MDLEKILAFLQSEEGKQHVGTLSSTLGLVGKDSITGLETKKNQLLGEKKALQTKLELFEKYGLTVDKIQDYTNTIDELEALKNAANKGKDDSNNVDLDVLKKRHARELKALEDKLVSATENGGKLEAELNKLIINSEISKAFDTYNVAVKHRPILNLAWSASAEVEKGEDGSRAILMKNSDGQTLKIDDFFKEWSASETSKLYVQAPNNTGGGAKGNNNNNNNSGDSGGDSQIFSDDDFND